MSKSKRWVNHLRDYAEVPDAEAFLKAIEAVCRSHGISISHEDRHGAFELKTFNEDDMQWLHCAGDARSK